VVDFGALGGVRFEPRVVGAAVLLAHAAWLRGFGLGCTAMLGYWRTLLRLKPSRLLSHIVAFCVATMC